MAELWDAYDKKFNKIEEYYPNALKETYSGVKGYIYIHATVYQHTNT